MALLFCAAFVAGVCSGSTAVAALPAIAASEVAPSDVPAPATRLKGYNVDPKKVFVAGVSSGGFFGVQMHVAHSSTFKGAAIYAGGVYHCSSGSLFLALLDCGGATLLTNTASYYSTLAESEHYLDRQSAAGAIDAENNLAGQPVYLWSGTNDSVINPLEMADLNAEYAHYGARITFDNAFPAEHGWESPDGEVACGTAASPYMLACAKGTQPYDSVRTWLTQFFGTLRPRNAAALRGTLQRFDQTEFGANPGNSMDTDGYVFVPKQCASGGRCGFVLALHGCLQNRSLIGTKFVTESGIDEWADTNGIVVLYPFAAAALGPVPYNPNDCWDWWGYDDADYALKSGTQISIVYSMVRRIVRGR